MSPRCAETSGAQEVLAEPFLSRACVSGIILSKKKKRRGNHFTNVCAILVQGSHYSRHVAPSFLRTAALSWPVLLLSAKEISFTN